MHNTVALKEKIFIETQNLFLLNRRTENGFQYTLPSPDLYPFQWLWDSCFHAIILSKWDVGAAKKELKAALSHPLPSGMLPHIIYWQEQKINNGNWGRELRGDIINEAWGVEHTSAITQPPIIAKAALCVYETDGDRNFLREIYPTLRAYYQYLHKERSLRDDGLLFIINPDESGEDNSPRFDTAQGLPPQHTANENLDKRIQLMKENVACKFNAKECTHQHFSIIDLSFNIIYNEGLTCMESIATQLGEAADAVFFANAAKQSTKSIKKSLCKDGICRSFDLKTNKPITVDTWNLFMPLYGGLLSKKEAQHLVEHVLLDKSQFWLPYPIPSTSKKDSAFDTADDAFWRGPVWMAPNWFMYHGLKRYGYDDIAQTLKEKTLMLIEQSGFREHYNPITGEGMGAPNFTWGGLVLDME